jgi:hypothetical protein
VLVWQRIHGWLRVADSRVQRVVPLPMTLGGRIALAVAAFVGVVSTLLNFFFPGSADSSQIGAVTFVSFVFLLVLIAIADSLFRGLRRFVKGEPRVPSK